jgi:hypothetical protein
MADDPCSVNVGWSLLAGAGADSTLAGVLAGFLIVAATALLTQWNDRSDPDTFALFASGVPALTLSSYLFTVLAGSQPVTGYCDQMWSQWLPAFALLLIGAAVLLCGLGWALVSYSDNLAVKLLELNRPMKRVEEFRRFFITLSGCLSLGGTTAMTCWLISATVVYVKATTGRQVQIGQGKSTTVYPSVEFLHVRWSLIFLVFLFGLYVVVRSAYLVVSRTRDARRENVASCARYTPGVFDSHTMPDERSHTLKDRVGQEISIAAAIALGVLVADFLTRHTLQAPFSWTRCLGVVGVLLAGYVVARLAYEGVVRYLGPTLRKRPSTEIFADADEKVQSTPSNEKKEDAIRIKYSVRRLSSTAYHVVLFSIVGTMVAAALTQGALWPQGLAGVSVLLGGFYPACVLLGLSYAVPAGPATKLPEWKTWRGWRLVP